MKNSIFYLSYRSNREKQNVIIQIRNFLWHWGHQLCYSQKDRGIFIDHMQPRTLLYVSADGQPPQAHGLQTLQWRKCTTKLGMFFRTSKRLSLMPFPPTLGLRIGLDHQPIYWVTQAEDYVSDAAIVDFLSSAVGVLLVFHLTLSLGRMENILTTSCCDFHLHCCWKLRDLEVGQGFI